MADAFILRQFNEWKAERAFSRLLIVVFCLAASLFLGSCATPYQPLDHHYGYAEQQVGRDVYEVSFLGNANSSYERAFDFALLRAAEIALSHRAKSFVLLDVVNLSWARAFQSAPLFYRVAGLELNAGGNRILPAAGLMGGPEDSYLVMEPGQQRTYYRPGAKLKIKLLADPPGSYYPYDPAKERDRLRRKYGIKSGN